MSADRYAGQPLEFRILGPIEVRAGDDQVQLRPKQRAVLAMLLLNANRTVTTGRLIDALWPASPPATPAAQIRMLISGIRKALGRADLIETRPAGYLLRVDEGRLDADRFRQQVKRAHVAAAENKHEVAAAGYDEALARRGTALEDVDGSFATADVAVLEEWRLRALDGRGAAVLALGRHAEAVAELTAFAVAHPLREQPHKHLMLALYLCGRVDEALEVYRRLRKRLTEELGLAPTHDLQRLHQRMLAGEPLIGRAPRPAARQLPAGTGQFVGRRTELRRLDELSTRPHRLVLVVGVAGAGKTALVVHWARGMAERFPDGQFFLDLHGFDQCAPTSPAEALTRLLPALGVPATDIPAGVDAQAALYRSTIAGRRIVVVLDNVAEPAQVRPLLSGDFGCLVLVTSRDRLGGLVAVDGADRLTLDVLPPPDALHLLTRTSGAARLFADPRAAAELVELCGRLPLALRIAAARLADQPHRGIRDYVDELTSHGRMAGLRVDDDSKATVRGAFDLSYQALPAPARRMFRLMGLVPAPSGLSEGAAAALACASATEAGRLLDTLARVHLVRPVAQGRFTCHDLLLEYAADLASAEESGAERMAATRRLLGFYLRTTDRATELTASRNTMLPRDPSSSDVPAWPLADVGEASAWLTAERDNVFAALRHAAEHGPYAMAWFLADALRGSVLARGSTSDSRAVAESGMAAARREHNVLAQAAMHYSFGQAHWRGGDYDRALDEYQRALARYGEAGGHESAAMATVLRGMGTVFAMTGQTRQAIDRFDRVIDLARSVGDRRGEAVGLTNLAAVHEEAGDLDQADRFHQRALPLLREAGQPTSEAIAYENLARVRREQGRLDEAMAALRRALAICRRNGALHHEGPVHVEMGLVHCDSGRYVEANTAHAAARAIATRLGDQRVQVSALCGLARVDLKLDRLSDAAGKLGTALVIAERTGERRGHMEVLLDLCGVHCAQGDARAAVGLATRALALARESGAVIHLARAHRALATVHLALDEITMCIDYARLALRAQRDAGQRLGQARTLMLLGRAHERDGRRDEAMSCWCQADALLTEIDVPERAEIQALLAKT